MRRKDKGLTRRQFITKSLGTAGLVAALSSPLDLVLNNVRASTNPPPKVTATDLIPPACIPIDSKLLILLY